MNYKEARVYLDDLSKYGSVLGLENIRELLCRLGNPQDELKFIHISGTNGKGSVLAFLSTILSGAGYRTGRYISPTLFSYRERIQVNGEYIEKDSLANHVALIKEKIEEMQREHVGSPTLFEVETALAFLYFKEKKCDVVVLETGLGGSLDATNIIKSTVLEVITSISMDHIGILGNTLEEIAMQKAGIIKPHTVVVSAEQKPEAAQVIRKVCEEQNCSLREVEEAQITEVVYGCDGQCFSYKNRKQIQISLAGSYQIKNAALALEAVQALRELGFTMTEEQIYQGFSNTVWKGRFTILSKSPVVVMDGAHNEAAAKELCNSLELYFKGRKLYYIFGMFCDKEYRKVIALTAPLAEHIVTVATPDNRRALPAEELKAAVALTNQSVESAESMADAFEKLKNCVTDEDVIVIFGSLSFLGEAEKIVMDEERAWIEKR